MKTYGEYFSDEKKKLLIGLTELGLSIVVNGREGSDREEVSMFLRQCSDLDLITKDAFGLQKLNRDGTTTFLEDEEKPQDNFIFLAEDSRHEFLMHQFQRTDYILVKCSYDEDDFNYYFNITLIKQDVRPIEALGNTLNFVALDSHLLGKVRECSLTHIPSNQYFDVNTEKEFDAMIDKAKKLEIISLAIRDGLLTNQPSIAESVYTVDGSVLDKPRLIELETLIPNLNKLGMYIIVMYDSTEIPVRLAKRLSYVGEFIHGN